MAETILKAGDPCPNCGGTLIVDWRQSAPKLIARRSANAASPDQAAVFARSVENKARTLGTIYYCPTCTYAARFLTTPPPAEGAAPGAPVPAPK